MYRIQRNLKDIEKYIRYTEMYTLYRNIYDIQKCIRYKVINTIKRNIYDVQKPIRHTEIYTIYRNLYDVNKRIPFTKIYTIYRNIYDVQTYIQYSRCIDMCPMGLRQFGDTDSAKVLRRCRFCDGTIRGRDMSAINHHKSPSYENSIKYISRHLIVPEIDN